ncbi:MAG: chromate transporter [Vicinamibacterales bacterium]
MRPPSPFPDTARGRTPRSIRELYWAFTILALQGFGGVLAVVQRELVERKRWLTREEFLEDWAVAQIMPGPNVVNLAITLGDRYFGWRGAAAAFAGMLSLPLVVVLAVAVLLGNAMGTVAGQGALRGMGAVAAGLIVATGLKLLPALRSNPMGQRAALVVMLATFTAIAWARLPLGWVVPSLGLCAWAWTWRCLTRLDAHGAAPAGDAGSTG